MSVLVLVAVFGESTELADVVTKMYGKKVGGEHKKIFVHSTRPVQHMMRDGNVDVNLQAIASEYVCFAWLLGWLLDW